MLKFENNQKASNMKPFKANQRKSISIYFMKLAAGYVKQMFS